VAVVPDASLDPSVLNEALAAVAPVVTLPLTTAAIVAAAASASSSSRKRRRRPHADGDATTTATTANPLAALLGTSLPQRVPPALRDALRLVGGLAHDYLSVPLPAWAGGDQDDDDDEEGEDGNKAAPPSDAALGWSVGGGSSSSKSGRWLAVAADPLAAGVSPAGGMAVPAASGAVLVFDVPPAALPQAATTTTAPARRTRAAAAAAETTTTTTLQKPLTQPHAVLVHELQRRVGCVAWRPGRPNHLAVGCAGGAALWSLVARPPSAAEGAPLVPPPPPAALGPGAASAFCTFLRHRRRARVTSLAWSPDGRLLAGASASSAALAVWDASMGGSGGSGGGARLRAALSSGLTRLSWSPCGRYLFAAGVKKVGQQSPLASALAPPGRFHLWETGRWRSRAWDVPAGGKVVAACWAGGGSAAASSASSGPVAPLLIAMSHASSLVALHLVGGPGTLAEQLLPVALPGVSDVCRAVAREGRGGVGGGGGGGGASPDGGCVADLAWDPSARRLAVALRAPHPAAGCLALYATRAAPVVSAQLVGFLRPFAGGEEGSGGGVAPSSRAGAGLRVAFSPQPLLPQQQRGGDDDDAYAPSAAGGAPAAILSVRDLLGRAAGVSAGGEGEEGEGEEGGAERVANIALHF
jgi:hypothetical protein